MVRFIAILRSTRKGAPDSISLVGSRVGQGDKQEDGMEAQKFQLKTPFLTAGRSTMALPETSRTRISLKFWFGT